MILFKTYDQADEDEQNKLRSLYGKKERFFAIFPRRLYDGRIAFMQFIYRTRKIEKYESMGRFKDLRTYLYTAD